MAVGGEERRVVRGPLHPQPPPPAASSLSYILRNITLTRDKVFMIEDLGEREGWREWSYGELGAGARAVAAWLGSRGGARGTVALCGPPTFHQLAFCLGAWTLGMTTHPLDTLSTKDELRRLLEASKVKLVYCSKEEDRCLMESLGVEVVGGAVEPPPGSSHPHPPTAFPLVQCIVYSSGTTAHPKAVKVTSTTLLFISSLFEMETDCLQRVLVVGMPFWMSFTVMINHCMKTGKTIILPRKPDDYQDIFRILHLHKPEFWMAPPHLLLAMARMDPGPGPVDCLKAVHVSGYSLPGDKKELIRDRVVGVDVKHWYATSEVGNITYWPDKPPDPYNPSVGHVCPHVLLKVVDSKTSEVLGPDCPGEIWVKTESMMAGYLGAKTPLQEGGWFRTGDIGYYDREELVYFVSRQKDVIRYLWLKIVPGELEEVLRGHPGVEEAVVAGRPHPTDGEHPVAFVVAHPHWKPRLTEAHLHSYLAERVSETKRLRGGIFFVDSLPRGPTGKVLRKKLTSMLGAAPWQPPVHPPQQGYRRPYGPGPTGLSNLPRQPLGHQTIRPASAVTN